MLQQIKTYYVTNQCQKSKMTLKHYIGEYKVKIMMVIGFYADKNNWWCPVTDSSFQIRIIDKDYEYTHYHNIGGKKARQLRKVNETNRRTNEKS